MKKIILILFIYFINHSVFAAETKKAYFAGGCFWCMEESYDQVDGVLSSISGYSGELIDQSFKEIEKKFDKKIVTLVWKFDIFYPAENYHQDYYEKNFIRYLMYKNACKREETLQKIWN